MVTLSDPQNRANFKFWQYILNQLQTFLSHFLTFRHFGQHLWSLLIISDHIKPYLVNFGHVGQFLSLFITYGHYGHFWTTLDHVQLYLVNFSPFC